jgi:hypothetical protein
MGYVNIDNFGLARLWSVCGDLCYPANIKADFPETNKTTKIFVKIRGDKKEGLDGYVITDQSIVGKIHISDNQIHSIFYNPYLANLPRPEFSYLAIPTANCESLESVLSVRYNHDIQQINNDVIVHRLTIIQDCVIRCVGFELYVRYITHGIPKDEKPIYVFDKIGLKSMILGDDISVSDGYAIQVHSVTKHSLSAKTRSNISRAERQSFYDAVIEFFKIYNQTNV